MEHVFGLHWAYPFLYPSSVECQDPCRNHKSYREVISKMKPPVIPFVPLILKGESSQMMLLYPRSSCPGPDSQSPPNSALETPRLRGFHGRRRALWTSSLSSLASLSIP